MEQTNHTMCINASEPDAPYLRYNRCPRRPVLFYALRAARPIRNASTVGVIFLIIRAWRIGIYRRPRQLVARPFTRVRFSPASSLQKYNGSTHSFEEVPSIVAKHIDLLYHGGDIAPMVNQVSVASRAELGVRGCELCELPL